MNESTAAPDPVFVVGTPRSGVRLLATLLDGHPDLASGPELTVVLTIARQWQDLARTLGTNHERHHGLPPNKVQDLYRTAILRLLMPRVRQAGKQRFVYHSFAAITAMDQFAVLFPTARFVLMLRDPRSVAASLLRCDWRNPRDGQPLPYTRDSRAGAQFWTELTAYGLRAASPLVAGGRLLQMKYEELCTEPACQLLRLGGFLQVEPPAPRLSSASIDAMVPSRGDSHPPLRSGALDQASLRRWRDVLDPVSLEQIEGLTESLRTRLGYA